MKILDRIAGRFGFVRAASPPARRGYAGAKIDRLMADWIMSPVAADAEIRAGMVGVRARARDLSINDPYIRGYLRSCRKNIVGHSGFRLQMKIKNPDGSLDTFANWLIEQRFTEWSRKGICEVSGRFSFRKVQSLVVTTMKRDGEAFIRKVRGSNINPFGFSLQLIEPDHVDETYNYERPDGRVIRMGVETDRWRRPVAYYVKTRSPGNELYGTITSPQGTNLERIPASDMIHVFDPDRFDQTRDVSHIAPIMTRIRHLSAYEEAAVVNARAGACKMGFFRDPEGTEGDYPGDAADASGNAITTAEPGTFEDIGKRDFVAYDPKFPSDQHTGFVKTNLHGIASGLGVSYASLSQDLADTSYSSARTGLVDEREEWKEQQAWIIETFLNDVFADWLDMAFLTGQLGTLPYGKFDKFNNPTWVGRRWAWVDPQKDLDSQTASVRAGFKAPSQIIAEQGEDIEDVYQKLKEDLDLAKEYGLTLDFGGKPDGKDTGKDEPDAPDSGEEDADAGAGNGADRGPNGRSVFFL